jgi:hypothetical protein
MGDMGNTSVAVVVKKRFGWSTGLKDGR